MYFILNPNARGVVMNCPTCGATVQSLGDRRYLHVQPEPVDLDAVKLRAIEDAFRIVEARLKSKPSLGWQRAAREELAEFRRVLGKDDFQRAI